MSLFHISKVDFNGNVIEAVCKTCLKPAILKLHYYSNGKIQGYTFYCTLCDGGSQLVFQYVEEERRQEQRKQELMAEAEKELRKALNL